MLTGVDGRELCIAALATDIFSDMNPFTISPASAGATIGQTTKAVLVRRAGNYAARKNLSYPLKSSIFRGMLAEADSAGAAGALISLNIAVVDAGIKNLAKVRSGKCSPSFRW